MDTVIEFKNVYKQFGSTAVLDDVSFRVQKHDVFGYIGPNGAGKTTSIRLTMGLLEPTQGEVVVLGGKPDQENIRSKIGFCFDNDGLYTNLTAYENMKFFDMVYHKGEGREHRIKELLEMVNLEHVSDKTVNEFSRGMRKRLGLARALLASPEILILDDSASALDMATDAALRSELAKIEPMIGLDPEGQADIKQIIQNAKETCTIFISSHNLNDVEELCNRVAILEHRILAEGLLENILTDTQSVVRVKLKENCSIDQLAGLYKLGIGEIKLSHQEMHLVCQEQPDISAITSFLLNNKINFIEIGEVNNSLREKYFSLVRGKNDHENEMSESNRI